MMEDASRHLKLEALFQIAVDHIIDLPELGVTATELQDPLP